MPAEAPFLCRATADSEDEGGFAFPQHDLLSGRIHVRKARPPTIARKKTSLPEIDQAYIAKMYPGAKNARCLFLFKTHPPAPAEARTGAGVAGS